MAKAKSDIYIEQTDEQKKYRMITVYLNPALLEDLLKIEGLRVLDYTSFPDHPSCFIDPRYDWDEVIQEIKNLGAPVPQAFLDEGE